MALLEDGFCIWDGGPPIPRTSASGFSTKACVERQAKTDLRNGLGLALARELAEKTGGRLEPVCTRRAFTRIFRPAGMPLYSGKADARRHHEDEQRL